MKLVHKIKRFFGFDIPYSAILRDAKTRLAVDCVDNNKSMFVCNTIIANYKQTMFLRDWIENLLDGHLSFEYWLYSNHNIRYRNPEIMNIMTSEEYLIKIQQTRLAWMEWMIDYWEAEESKLSILVAYEFDRRS